MYLVMALVADAALISAGALLQHQPWGYLCGAVGGFLVGLLAAKAAENS